MRCHIIVAAVEECSCRLLFAASAHGRAEAPRAGATRPYHAESLLLMGRLMDEMLLYCRRPRLAADALFNGCMLLFYAAQLPRLAGRDADDDVSRAVVGPPQYGYIIRRLFYRHDSRVALSLLTRWLLLVIGMTRSSAAFEAAFGKRQFDLSLLASG